MMGILVGEKSNSVAHFEIFLVCGTVTIVNIINGRGWRLACCIAILLLLLLLLLAERTVTD